MALSPMMQQYMETKQGYKDCLLFYRLGDFYELFFEDAEIASKLLDLTLTGRNCGLEDRAPMCGVPYHAVDAYIAKALAEGYKVAICDQLTDPEPGKIVQRDVTRVITPGTVMESSILEEKKNNYIMSISQNNNEIGVAYADITTGEFCLCEVNENIFSKLNDIIVRVKPTEIICNEQMFNKVSNLPNIKTNNFPKFQKYEEWSFDLNTAQEIIKKQLNVQTLAKYDYAKKLNGISASGALINYLLETQKRSLGHINKIILIRNEDYMYLDNITVRNLELIETTKDKKKRGSLLGVVDQTRTSMGGRLMTNWVLQPLQKQDEINDRLNCVEILKNHPIELNDLIHCLSKISDIQRLTGKISYGSVMPRDCLSLKASLQYLPELKNILSGLEYPTLKNLLNDTTSYNQIFDFIDKAINEDSPAIISGGGFIKKGFNLQLDELKEISKTAQKWLTDLENKEREETGIKSLKIGYTRVFGYYIEINKSQQDMVPYRYQRRQTISNHERYITEELKQIEEKILGADDTSIKLEQELYTKIKESLSAVVPVLQSASNDIARLDCLVSFASIAQKNDYVKPIINEQIKEIKIEEGRHPVVELFIGRESFIPNDTYISEQDHTMIITGPNMAGKSTYMRQVALITLMAHMGCFVPATKAEISITDRIFTRIGASDDLAFGQSTFMVEMMEVSNIINNATKNSLLILDEVGRGTSTYDGLSIAWAVIEYIAQKIKAKTLFATHYHELTDLEGHLNGVKNYQISVKEFNNSIIFLRKIVRGGADRSFGIEVAEMAGIYKEIIGRAKEILHKIEQSGLESSINGEVKRPMDKPKKDEIIGILKDLKIETLSPLVAFDVLNDLINKAKKE